jgi:SAM-dependent methyltransferase
MTTYGGRQVVNRIEDGMDRQEVAATTYQMRNFYKQLRDGFFTRLDVFNYMSHHQIAQWASKRDGANLLDVCCGRGLLLPLLRYNAPDLGSYTGLDIAPKNAIWTHRRVTDDKPIAADDYYPFPTEFVEGNVADADTLLSGREFEFIIYTASIEHMHPDDGLRSLHALHAVAAKDCTLVLTCPNTPPDQSGYDTRYRAHVYEWKLEELRSGLTDAGWTVVDTWGLDMPVKALEEAMREAFAGHVIERVRKYIPNEWLVPVLAPMFPALSTEVGLLCRP